MESTESKTRRAARYASLPQDLLDWAERAGYENLKGRMETERTIAAQSATLMTLLIAGIGGALTYAVKVLEPPAALSHIAGAWVCLYWFLLALVLMLKCVNAAPAPLLYNEPGNLLDVPPDATLHRVRVGEIANLQDRIEEQTLRNAARARWLNRVRMLVAATPVAVGAIMWLVHIR